MTGDLSPSVNQNMVEVCNLIALTLLVLVNLVIMAAEYCKINNLWLSLSSMYLSELCSQSLSINPGKHCNLTDVAVSEFFAFLSIIQ